MDNNYGEILCTAIDEIISTRLQGLSFDITKQCTIKDDSRAYQGRYVVSDGGSKFEAFSSDTSFKNGNSVLVTIPNGDFTMQKTIIGRIASVDTTPFKYMSPLDSMIKIENTMLKDIMIPETGLLANQMMVNGANSTSGTMIKCFEVPESIVNSAQFKGFTRLGIQADFKTILNGLDIKEGSYGLKIYIHADKITSPGEVDKEGLWELTFSSSEMVGNPYKFATYFQQEKVFDISDIANIKKIEVYLYQNSNFKDISGNLISHQYQSYIPTRINANTDLTEKEYYYLSNNNYIKLNTFNPNLPMTTKYFYLEEGYLPNNIFVNNFKFYLGYELERYDGETLELYPIGSTTSYHHSRQHELKRINLRWIHQDENGNISLLEKDENNNCMILPDNLTTEDFYEVRWFRYNFGHPVIDEYAKVNWERIEKYTDYILLDSELTREEFDNNKNNINYAYLNESNQYIDIIEWPDGDFTEDTQFFTKVEKNAIDEFVFAPNINLQTEKIKVVGVIRKNNGRQLDKKTIEADNVHILFSEVKSFWDAIPLLEDGKHPYQKEFFTDGGKDTNNNQIYNKYDGTPTEEEELNLFIKLSYLQIVAMQNTIKPENFTDSGSSKASAQYLEAMANFVNLFPNIPAYIYEPYSSKELIFTNEEKVVDQLTYDAATALSIICEDGSEGNYLIYDQNGHLKNEGQGNGYERQFKLTYKGLEIDTAFEYLDDIDWVEWYIPSDYYDVHTSTMLVIPNAKECTSSLRLDGVDYLTFRYNKEYVLATERYPEFTREIFLEGKYYLQDTQDTSKYIETKEWNNDYTYYEYRFAHFRQSYSIKNDWVESNSNNLVRVALSINGNTYEALKDLRFGKGGSNGTNATFLLEFMDNANALETVPGKQIKVKARLYEGQQEVEIPASTLMNNTNWLQWKFELLDSEDFIEILPWEVDENNIPIYESGKATLYINESETTKIPVEPIRIYNNSYSFQSYTQVEPDENAFYFIKNAQGNFVDKRFQNYDEFKAYIGYNPSIRYLRFKKDILDIDSCFKNNFHILQGTYEWNNINLVTYLSVPLKSNTSISHIEGTKEVNYNHQGQPSYYANPYKLLKKVQDGGYEELTSLTWDMNDQEIINIEKINTLSQDLFNQNKNTKRYYYEYAWPLKTLETLTEEQFYKGIATGSKYYINFMNTHKSKPITTWPFFVDFLDGPYNFTERKTSILRIHEWPTEGFLQGTIFYQTIQDSKNVSYVPSLQRVNNKFVFTPSIYFAEGAQNKICVYCYDTNYQCQWSQPILIYKHRYDFDILNAWNGGLQTDEANGTIMANMLGAGRKNTDDNTFSGVMIGDMAKGTGHNKAYAETGVYGLYHGDVSFALKDDGTATFGVAGRGQIHLNGNESTITSQGYLNNEGGLFIDLDDGIISIEESSSSLAALRMTSADNTRMINVDKDKQYFQSNKYLKTNGMQINLGDGYIENWGKYGGIKISRTSPYLQIKGTVTPKCLYLKDGTPIYSDTPYQKDVEYYYDQNLQHLANDINNENLYYSYFENSLKTMISIGADKENPFYLQSINYRPGQEKVQTDRLTDVYYYSDENETTYISENPNMDKKWCHCTKESGSDIYTLTGTLISAYDEISESSQEYKDGLEAWKNVNKTETNDNPTPTNEQKEQIKQEIIDGKVAAFTANYKQLYAASGEGLKLNLESGIIEGYNLYLRAINKKTNQDIIIDSGGAYPLEVGNGFKIAWDGKMTCKAWHYGTIKPESKYKNSVLCINSKFYVSSNGTGRISNSDYADSAGYAKNASALGGHSYSSVITNAQNGMVSSDQFTKLLNKLSSQGIDVSGV